MNIAEKTKVIFRQFHDGDIIALFPEIPADNDGKYCQSYQITGQHGGASYAHIIKNTVRAVCADYKDTHKELEKLYGYKITVYHRLTAGMRKKFACNLKSII